VGGVGGGEKWALVCGWGVGKRGKFGSVEHTPATAPSPSAALA
jgi:hypothetical protein